MQIFFEVNTMFIYFFYGMIFFLMGFAILVKNRVHSQFTLAKSIKYLAYFGILHGVADIGLFFIPIQSSYLSNEWIDLLVSFQVIINGLSFSFLLMFGIHLLVLTKKWSKTLLYIPVFIFSFWFSCFILLQPLFVNEGNQEWWMAISDIWSRYLMAFPGGMLACWGLIVQKKQFIDYDMDSMTRTLYFSAFSMVLYAVVGGLVVQYAPMLPTILFNSERFLTTLGFPIEIIRGLAGLFMSIFIIRILRVFDLEYQVYLYHAEKTHALNEERNRIARDLHDGMIQSIYALGLQLEGTKHIIAQDKETDDKPSGDRAEKEINHVIQRLNETIIEIRGYIKDLRLPLNSSVTMTKEIERLIDYLETDNHFSIKYTNHFQGDSPTLPVSIQVYYILKESLVNIMKHADATEVSLSITGNKTHFEVVLADNGKGFEKSSLGINDTSLYQHGIRNMKYRAKIINANLEIMSNQEGTTIKLNVEKRGKSK